MKHVFLVHSNITYLSALGTICKENISDNDVLIITRYKLSDDLPIVAHHLDFTRSITRPWKSKWLTNPLGYIDSFLKKNVGDESYIAYLDAMVLPAKVLISNKQCAEFHFIEEGASSYYDSVPMPYILFDDISLMSWPLRYDSFSRKVVDVITVLSGISLKNYALPYMPQCYYYADGVKFYGFGEKSFRGAKIRKLLSWTEIATRFKFEKKYQLSDKSIWVGIPPQAMTIHITPQDYEKGILKKCVPFLQEHGIKRIYLKHHPVCTEAYKKAEVGAFQDNGIEVEIIPDDVCLEMEFLGENNITIYTVMSSVVEYALQMGNNKCYSIAQCFPGYIEEDGTDIWDRVEQL